MKSIVSSAQNSFARSTSKKRKMLVDQVLIQNNKIFLLTMMQKQRREAVEKDTTETVTKLLNRHKLNMLDRSFSDTAKNSNQSSEEEEDRGCQTAVILMTMMKLINTLLIVLFLLKYYLYLQLKSISSKQQGVVLQCGRESHCCGTRNSSPW